MAAETKYCYLKPGSAGGWPMDTCKSQVCPNHKQEMVKKDSFGVRIKYDTTAIKVCKKEHPEALPPTAHYTQKVKKETAADTYFELCTCK